MLENLNVEVPVKLMEIFPHGGWTKHRHTNLKDNGSRKKDNTPNGGHVRLDEMKHEITRDKMGVLVVPSIKGSHNGNLTSRDVTESH